MIKYMQQQNRKQKEQESKLTIVSTHRTRKKSFTNNLNQAEQSTDIKGYRMIMHTFTNNINSYYYKQNKKCICQIDRYNRMQLTKEEKQQLEDSELHNLFLKQIDKVKKEMLNRNTRSMQAISKYTDAYCKLFKVEIAVEPFKSKVEPIQIETSRKKSQKRPQTSRPKSSSYYSQKSRDTSRHPDLSQMAVSVSEINNIDGEVQIVTQKARLSHRKYSVQGQNLNEWKQNQKSINYSHFLQRNEKKVQRRSINEIQVQKIHQELISKTNPKIVCFLPSQGYQAKSKCWKSNKKIIKYSIL